MPGGKERRPPGGKAGTIFSSHCFVRCSSRSLLMPSYKKSPRWCCKKNTPTVVSTIPVVMEWERSDPHQHKSVRVAVVLLVAEHGRVVIVNLVHCLGQSLPHVLQGYLQSSLCDSGGNDQHTYRHLSSRLADYLPAWGRAACPWQLADERHCFRLEATCLLQRSAHKRCMQRFSLSPIGVLLQKRA